MGRRYFNDGQEVVLEDLNAITSTLERTMYDRLVYEIMQRTENAFFDDGFEVNYASSTAITIIKGLGFYSDVSQSAPEPQKRPLYLGSNESLSISAPDGSNDRIDIVCVAPALVDEISATRKFKDAISSTVTNESMVVGKDWEADIQIVAGTPAASPSTPATPTGYIKIAELYVTAVTGMSGAGAVTDSRDQMPVGGLSVLNTLGYLRLTAGAATPLSTLMSDIDALMVNGLLNTNTFSDSVTDPAAPSVAGQKKMYLKGDVLYLRDSSPDGSAITPVGSGGGGGGGLIWQEPAGSAPLKTSENDQEVYLFEQGLSQKLTVFIKVPDGFVAGRQISAFLGAYSPSTSNDWNMQIVSTLIRKNVDAISSTTNQNTDDSGDITNTVANMYRLLEIPLTSATGTINSVSIQAGDIIKLELTRPAPVGTEDTADLRFIPTSTEVKFG